MPSKDTERDTKLRESYTAATKRLRENHHDEFNRLRVEEAKARGVEWSPTPTEKDKAKATLWKLLEEHPGIIEEMQAEAAAQGEEPPEEVKIRHGRARP